MLGKAAGYHLCINRMWKRVTIHAHTDRPQHLPKKSRNNGYWLGPYATLDEAQDAAQEVTEQHDYEAHRCRKCFHAPQALDARQRRARERMVRGDWMSGVGEQPSRNAIRKSRSR